jgi:tRNA dimethylallyltransferase
LKRLAICGASATGKTALALALAERLGDAELVSVDSMCVYREMDIGTAKPLGRERAVARWHLLDLVDPSEEFSVSRFQAEARAAISGIEARGHHSLLVGGTGLYHRAVIDDLDIPEKWPELAADLARQASEEGGLDSIRERLAELDPLAASRIEPNNERRLIRALEVTLGSGRPFSSFGPGLTDYGDTPFLLIGLRRGREETGRRLEARLDEQLRDGFVDEVRRLAARNPPLSRTARQALGYRELLTHVEEGVSLAEARGEALRRMRLFTKRQESWFGRDPRIQWLDADRPDLADAALELLDGHAGAGRQVRSRNTRRVEGTALALEKLHGAGNDFLVLIDPDDEHPISAELARALCARRTGIGADGLIRALPPTAGGDLRMELRNADGGLAETSGNGLRCLVLAALRAGMVSGGSIAVETAAGVSRVETGRGDGTLSVEMGEVELGDADFVPPGVDLPHGSRARSASVGNPHVVIAVESLDDVDVAAIGSALDSSTAGGVNVEIVSHAAGAGGSVIDLVVWERGAGATLACGSGSCAAAAAVRAWGLAGDTVVVRNPGGDLTVELSGDALRPKVTLTGPAEHVATVTIEIESSTEPSEVRADGDDAARPAGGEYPLGATNVNVTEVIA